MPRAPPVTMAVRSSSLPMTISSVPLHFSPGPSTRATRAPPRGGGGADRLDHRPNASHRHPRLDEPGEPLVAVGQVLALTLRMYFSNAASCCLTKSIVG